MARTQQPKATKAAKAKRARAVSDETPRKAKAARGTAKAKPARAKTRTSTPARSTRAAAKATESPARRKRAVEQEEEVPVRTRKTKVSEAVEEFFNPLANIDDQLDAIEKDYSLSGSSMNPDEVRQTTGLLAIDLILGRGLIPGWYTFFGPEQSCKSTGASTLLGAALNSEVPIIQVYDFEGSMSHDYLSNIIRTQGFGMDIKHVFGLKDAAGSWIVKPRVRVYSEGVAEKFFDSVARLERTLPDKVKINDQWYYVYENTKVNQKALSGHYDPKYLTKTGKLRVPAKDGTLQALIIVDSYPAMLPERLDVDDPGSGMAAQARMFSDQLKRVKGKMKAKRIAIVGVNQLRKAPGVMYGNPEYEPGGEALKFFSDVRLRVFPRALSAVPGAKGKGMIEEEPSVAESGGKDTYRYIHIRAHKNKLSVPNLEGWLRLWITDGEGVARGFDPVWDTYTYLVSTGQVSGKRSALKFNLIGKDSPKKTVSWLDFKALVVGSKASKLKVFKTSWAGIKPFDLRAFCKRQLHEKNGLELYFNHSKADADTDADGAED